MLMLTPNRLLSWSDLIQKSGVIKQKGNGEQVLVHTHHVNTELTP